MTAEKVRFTEEQSTGLATLYGRALDSRLDEPILGDATAEDAVRRIDYDFGKFGMTPSLAASVAARAKMFDDRVRAFLREYPDATVLHLGAGMDSRAHRLDPGPEVRWFDVDYPDVIELRERIYPARPGYRTIASSVTELGWLERVPKDRPALVVAEGLTMYLTAEGGSALLRGLAGSLPSGEMIFDTYSRAAIRMQRANPVVRRAGATLSWGVDDPRELEKLGITLVERLDVRDYATPEILARIPRALRFQLKLLGAIPALRNMGQILRYRF